MLISGVSTVNKGIQKVIDLLKINFVAFLKKGGWKDSTRIITKPGNCKQQVTI